MASQLRVGIDIGGTFTDAVAVSREDIRIAKVPSDPAHPGAAVVAAVEALNLAERPQRFLHGTTLVTNFLLERKGAPTGFITSHGMRDVLHIGRHERPFTYAIHQEIPQQHHPPVPRRWRLAIPERIDADGEVSIPIDEQAVRKAARKLVAAGVQAVAIGFLHSYRYPDHERLAERWVREEAPDVFVSTSSEVSPRFREYERFLTTAWNARVAPGAARYLAFLAQEIETRWPGLHLTLMTSNGGLESVDMQAAQAAFADLRRTPIRLALSGPAAAGNAVARVAHDLDLPNCVGLDVGGTSSDIVVVREGRLREAPLEERRVGGYPLQVPMLDLGSIGAGGGSIVRRDAFGTLHVGPQSAGADPGPACYARGGKQATVTDAAVVAGRLPPDVLLGGTMPLQADLASLALASTFNTSGEGVVRAALEVLTLAEASIAFAIRERTVARGLDPAELALVAAGGAGPLLACGIAETLGLAEVVVPPLPGLLAAWGLLVAPERRESTVTVLRPLAEVTPEEGEAYFARATKGLSATPPPGAQVLCTAALRYLGQGFEVEIKVEDPTDLAALAARFHDAHEHEYGFALRDSPVEWVELRVAWEVPAEDWAFPDPDSAAEAAEEVVLWELHADPTDGAPRPAQMMARVLRRRALRAGDEIDGPAVLLERDATIYIPTGWKVTATAGGYLRIRHHEH
jgi:N-methylhydantoinase A/oxoprolinase/acetone carboxylase beta subunit